MPGIASTKLRTTYPIWPGSPNVEVEVQTKPYDGRHILKPGSYEFELLLVAEDLPPIRYTVRLENQGIWARDEKIWNSFRLADFTQANSL